MRAVRQPLSLAGGRAPKFKCSFDFGRLPKHPFEIIIRALGHQIPGPFGQLARQRFGRDHIVGPGCFAIKPLAALLIEATREVGSLYKRPRQIFVAALGVVLTLFPAVGNPLSLHRSAVTGEVARAGKPRDLPDFQRDRHS
jgi:hypothetical protein